MFRFEHPEFFWTAVVTGMIVIFYYYRQRIRTQDWLKWSSKSSYQRISSQFNDLSFGWLLILTAVFLSFAAVNPQWGYKTENVDAKTADIYILLDISNSMLAEDVAPSRLEKARRFALDLSDAFKSDRIGLVSFAGNAYIQSPLTTDWHAIQLYLSSANPSQAGTQGTAIGEAIEVATSLRNEEEELRGGALIVITDGEDHDSDAASSITDAVAKGWITYIIGVGTEQGATIPYEINGRQDVKRDESGQPVVTRMNRQLMITLAQQGGGKYFDLNDGKAIIDNLRGELDKLERTKVERRSFSEYRSYYQWFIMAALFTLLLYVSIRYKHDVV